MAPLHVISCMAIKDLPPICEKRNGCFLSIPEPSLSSLSWVGATCGRFPVQLRPEIICFDMFCDPQWSRSNEVIEVKLCLNDKMTTLAEGGKIPRVYVRFVAIQVVYCQYVWSGAVLDSAAFTTPSRALFNLCGDGWPVLGVLGHGIKQFVLLFRCAPC